MECRLRILGEIHYAEVYRAFTGGFQDETGVLPLRPRCGRIANQTVDDLNKGVEPVLSFILRGGEFQLCLGGLQ